MATSRELIKQALAKIGIRSSSGLNANLEQEAFEELKNFCAEQEANGVNLLFVGESDIAIESGIDKGNNSAVVSLLAKRMAENMGVTTSAQLEMQAALGAQTLVKNTMVLNANRHSNRMPTGSGNRRRGRFFHDEKQEEDTILVINMNGNNNTVGTP